VNNLKNQSRSLEMTPFDRPK